MSNKLKFGDELQLNYDNKSLFFVHETLLQKDRVVSLANYLQIESDYQGGPMRLVEPDTLNWIKGFDNDDVLFDIGANMGIFTIFAAVVAKARVIAFEPSLNESKVLNANIFRNNLTNRVDLYGGCGLSNEEGFDMLYMQKFSDFQSNFIGEKKDEYLEEVFMEFKQGCYKTTIDNLLFRENFDKPDHIKIDVDGIEHLIIEGAAEALTQKIAKSINVEVNAKVPEHHQMIKTIKDNGYEIVGPDLLKLRQIEDKSKAICNIFCYRK